MPSPPIFLVDFNELVERNLVLLSATDQREDVVGQMFTLAEGMKVLVSEQDVDEHGGRDDLVASGTVIPNEAGGWTKQAKWSCLIDERGIRHRSDLLHTDDL